MKGHGQLLMLLMSPVVWAGGLEDCKQDAASASCSAYLNGVVDSALLLGGKQAETYCFGERFSERALSSRAGERAKHTNARYCADQLPDAARLKARLVAQFGAHKVDSVNDMYSVLAAELSCYREPR
ncbi:hypothetical protein [Aeromonas sp. MdU4]|uniref:hypothetical protein n=1 Tax=Aeromonas sp. MdU4 TaxID=3342819 RepID=UPI0035BA706D